MASEFQTDVQTIAVELNFIKDRLARLGMFKTMHAVDKVTGALGYELAEKLEPIRFAPTTGTEA